MAQNRPPFISWYGGHSGGATPEPIPNSEVKPPSDAPSTAVWRERGDAAGHFLLYLGFIFVDSNFSLGKGAGDYPSLRRGRKFRPPHYGQRPLRRGGRCSRNDTAPEEMTMIVKVEDFRRTGETGISPARGASRFRRLAECHRNYRRRAIAPIPFQSIKFIKYFDVITENFIYELYIL